MLHDSALYKFMIDIDIDSDIQYIYTKFYLKLHFCDVRCT